MTEAKTVPLRARWQSGWRGALLWIPAFAPAIFVLAYIMPRRVPVPYHDSWAFVKQYQDWCEGHYGWRDFLAPHNHHPSAAGKAVYFAVLEWCRGDVALLPLVTWALALVVSLCVLGLSRSLWRDRPAQGAGLMFLANLAIFTLAQGHSWIWDFVFQNAIAGACLMTGLWALSPPGAVWWRWALAALCGAVAAFSFGTGSAVGFLLLPAAWLASGKSKLSGRIQITALWAAGAAVVAWLALVFFVIPGVSLGHPAFAGRIEDLLDRPWDTAVYVLALLGHILGQGTLFEPVTICALWGAILLVVFVACAGTALSMRDASMLRESWPWMAMCLWALLNAATICFGRFRASLDTALAARYGTFMLFMVCGVMLLAAWTIRRAGDRRLGKWLKVAAAPAAAALVVFHLLAWEAGSDSLKVYLRRMSGEKAALAFANALPPQGEDILWQLDDTNETGKFARFLNQRDRLRGVNFVPDAALSRWYRSVDAPEKWAHWNLVRRDDGEPVMQGVCGLSKNLVAMPDLVLVTAATPDTAETIVALAAPLLPDDFFQRELRRRQHNEHYFSWRWPVNRARLPQGGEVTLRAYCFDDAGRKIRLIHGEAKLPPVSP